MINLLNALVEFPEGSGFNSLIYGLLEGLHSFIGSYGIAIIFFTLVLRIVMLPLDFVNKYFTKKNAMKMAELKPEIDALRQRYGNDPLSMNRAQQEVYKRNGYSPGGMCLVLLINIGVSLFIFITVMNSLRTVSNYNLYVQYAGVGEYGGLAAVYQKYEGNITGFDEKGAAIFDDPEAEKAFKAEANKVYDDTRVSFMWVNNMWRPDSWDKQTLTYGQFKSATAKYFSPADEIAGWADMTPAEQKTARTDYWNNQEAIYKAIFIPIESEHEGWNGLLLLVIMAGAVTYLSAVVNAKISAAKKTADGQKAAAEPVVQYSMRNARTQGGAASDGQPLPEINPMAVGKTMKVILPIIMLFFALSSTAAFALYITVSSAFATGFSILTGIVVDKILGKQAEKQKSQEPTVINPHAKYFKQR